MRVEYAADLRLVHGEFYRLLFLAVKYGGKPAGCAEFSRGALS
jgi:hypothetical protein